MLLCSACTRGPQPLLAYSLPSLTCCPPPPPAAAPHNSVLCRYYLQGACAFGDKCRFSHNKQQDEPSQVTYSVGIPSASRCHCPGRQASPALTSAAAVVLRSAGLPVLPGRQLRIWRQVPLSAQQARVERQGPASTTQVGAGLLPHAFHPRTAPAQPHMRHACATFLSPAANRRPNGHSCCPAPCPTLPPCACAPQQLQRTHRRAPAAAWRQRVWWHCEQAAQWRQ